MGGYYKYFGDVVGIDDVNVVGVQVYIGGIDNQQVFGV